MSDLIRTSWREASRNQNPASEHERGYPLDAEHLNAGSLMRIADAVELMAKDRVQMENDLKFWRERAYAMREENERLGHVIRGLRGRISRLMKTQAITT